MGLLALKAEDGDDENLINARLVGLFLDFLCEKGSVTASENKEFKRYCGIVHDMMVSAVAWDDEADDAIPSNKFIFPDDEGNHIDTPRCPGACCCSTGLRSCGSWYPIVAFI